MMVRPALLIALTLCASAHATRRMETLIKNRAFAPGGRFTNTNTDPLFAFLPATAQVTGCSDDATYTGTKGEALTFTRASTATCQAADGAVVPMATGKPRVEGGTIVTPAGPWNLVIGNNFAAWGGGGITLAQGDASCNPAPDGTNTAWLATPTTTNSSLALTTATATGQQTTFGVWIRRANGAGATTLGIYNEPAAGVDITPTTTWTQYSSTTSASTSLVRIGGYSSYSNAADGAVCLWRAQMNWGGALGLYADTTAIASPKRAPAVVTGARLRSETTSTNSSLNSAAIDLWGASGTGTVTANTAVAPDGTLSADTYATTNNTSIMFNAATVPSNTAFVHSVWMSSVSGTANPSVGMTCAPASCTCATSDGSACSTGTFGSTLCYATATVGTTPVRVEARVVCNAAQTSINRWVAGGVYGVSTGTARFWGSQLEAGATAASSYIPTAGTATVRAPDAASVTGSWALGTTPCIGATVRLDRAGAQQASAGASNSASNFFAQGRNPTAGKLRTEYQPGSQIADSAGSVTTGVTYRWVSRADGTNFNSCVDGACTATAATVGGTSTFGAIGIGSVLGLNQLNGLVGDVKVSNTATGCN